MSDNKWRVTTCCCIGGMKAGSLPPGEECDHCLSGILFIRPGGHLFTYPGGPAAGRSSAKEYDAATPWQEAAR